MTEHALDALSIEERATNYETMKHIHLVGSNINKIIYGLMHRGENHDISKLASPEVEAFTAETKNLSGLTYGSPAYFTNLEKIAPALKHHYANNCHHPQHFPKGGINEMNLVDITEMFCDWAASCKRHADGNLRASIEKNADRFGMSPQLTQILYNTMELMEE